MPVAGILVENGLSSFETRSHWWNLFYLEDFGWIPVDVSLGGGLQFNEVRKPDDPANFYFGSLDSRHIAFSTGWKTIKQSLVNSKSVYRPRTYAFQSVWEEASASIREYSSFWNEPVVLGLY
jgi:transglutaminase-like putative cysteine protease